MYAYTKKQILNSKSAHRLKLCSPLEERTESLYRFPKGG